MKRIICVMLCLGLLLSGCGNRHKNSPVTLTIWHVYGGQTDSPLNDLIDEFNQTIGKDRNISIRVTSVTNTNTIHEGVLAAANQEPGAPELPDMFVSYPKTVLAMPDAEILVDYGDYFSQEELQSFVPEFLSEGRIDQKLRVLPLAKSTEVLFVNRTLFDRFSQATGAELSQLDTWEGLYETAEQYCKWSGGKSFFAHDYHFNYFQVGVESLGEHFFREEGIAFGDGFRKVWRPYADAAIRGGVWLHEGYATEPLRTADAVVSVASSASVLYYADVVTYSDNTSEKVEFAVRPCPVFQNGDRVVMQRGAGICTVRSTPEREQAAMVFLKWITQPERNTELVTRLGYMPVVQEAFDNCLPETILQLEDRKYQELYRTFLTMQEDYRFYTPPQREDYLMLETQFERQIRILMTSACKQYQQGENPEMIAGETLKRLEEYFSHI